jgi:hypothetical protein
MMANYVYDVADLERNHELYARSGQIACSGASSSWPNRPRRRITRIDDNYQDGTIDFPGSAGHASGWN